MLKIFKGSDLAFAEFDRKVCVWFTTCIDLTGWSAKFCLLDNEKTTDDITSRLWTFGYTAEETEQFPLGKTLGKLILTDQSGQIRQMTRVEVEVVNQKVEPCMAGSIAVSVDHVISDYNLIGNKPKLNGKTIEGAHDSEYYNVASATDLNALSGKVIKIVTGKFPITNLLFTCEDDPYHYFKLQVVKRPDGAGHYVPAIALDAVDINDEESDSSEG